MNVAAFTEIVSVSMHAISRFDKIAHPRREHIGIWGDGNLGYITALLAKKTFKNQKSSFSAPLMKSLPISPLRMKPIW